MEPLTIDDLLHLLGQKEAQIAQLQRYVRELEARPLTLEGAEVIPVSADPNGQRATARSTD